MILHNMIHYSENVVVHNECTVMYKFVQSMGDGEIHPVPDWVKYFSGLGHTFE